MTTLKELDDLVNVLTRIAPDPWRQNEYDFTESDMSQIVRLSTDSWREHLYVMLRLRTYHDKRHGLLVIDTDGEEV